MVLGFLVIGFGIGLAAAIGVAVSGAALPLAFAAFSLGGSFAVLAAMLLKANCPGHDDVV